MPPQPPWPSCALPETAHSYVYSGKPAAERKVTCVRCGRQQVPCKFCMGCGHTMADDVPARSAPQRMCS